MRTPFLIICVVVSAAFIVYFLTGHAASGTDTLVMPLDDAYIHFQYARMIAAGQPFRYQPGEPYTSGATSLLYPFVLAAGYALGFSGMTLSLWAVGIGLLSWIGSAWLVFLIVRNGQDQIAIPLIVSLAFALTGSLAFAFMSGMETGLFVFLTLWTLYHTVRGDLRGMLIAGTLATITRPEGVVIAVGACAYFVIIQKVSRRWWPLLTIPLLAAMIQPLINLALTGSLSASGMQAKSYFNTPPADFGYHLTLYGRVFGTILRGLLTGGSEEGFIYISPLLSVLAALMLFSQLIQRLRRRRAQSGLNRTGLSLLVGFWLVGVIGLLAVLDNAPWQFKRYQQVIFALFYVAAGIFLVHRSRLAEPIAVTRSKQLGALVLLIFAGWTGLTFAGYFQENVAEIVSVNVRMARFVAANTPPTARIGVHDAGVVAYLSERPIYDVVGLTTANPPLAWRSGPGVFYDTMRANPRRPDYLAIYPLSELDELTIYGEEMARFVTTGAAHLVATASFVQRVTALDWKVGQAAERPVSLSPGTLMQLTLANSLNIGDLYAEARAGYRWWNAARNPGFASAAYRMETVGCAESSCTISDGGRWISGGEQFAMNVPSDRELLWVTRIVVLEESQIAVYANGTRLGTLLLRPVEGVAHWQEIQTTIPASVIAQGQLSLEMRVEHGVYRPFYHWFYNVPTP